LKGYEYITGEKLQCRLVIYVTVIAISEVKRESCRTSRKTAENPILDVSPRFGRKRYLFQTYFSNINKAKEVGVPYTHRS
jgi:hypothetical protein